MKVRCILKEGINGAGYEEMKFNEIRNLNKALANKLIEFSYVEVTGAKTEETEETEEAEIIEKEVLKEE